MQSLRETQLVPKKLKDLVEMGVGSELRPTMGDRGSMHCSPWTEPCVERQWESQDDPQQMVYLG